MKLAFFLFVVFSFPLRAQNFTKGEIIDTVNCANNVSQSYALYLPSNYSAEQAWPIIYIFEPAARGTLAVKIFQKSAEKFGYIIACSNNSKNGSWTAIFQAARAMKKDTELKFNIDEKRIYSSGFSGGSRAAMAMAKTVFKARGIIACGGAYPSKGQYLLAAQDNIVYTAIVGNLDMNYLEHNRLAEELTVKGIDNILFISNSTHQWASSNEVFRAVEWLELKTNEKLATGTNNTIINNFRLFGDSIISQGDVIYALPLLEQFESDFDIVFLKSPSKMIEEKSIQKLLKSKQKAEVKEQKQQKVYMQSFASLLKTKLDPLLDSIHTIVWWKSEIDKFKKKATTGNNYQSKSAQRLSNYIWVRFAEISFSLEKNADYLLAIEMNKLWQYSQPLSVWAVFNKAKLYALNGDDDLAILSLYEAKNLGLERKNSLESQPSFDRLKDLKKYQDLLVQLKD